MAYEYSHEDPTVLETVHHMLEASPSYRELDDQTRTELAQALSKIANYLTAENGDEPVARQMAPDLSALRPQNSTSPRPAAPADRGTATGQPATAGASPGSSGGSGTTGRAGEVARATLNAIDFPAFVASLNS